MGSEGMGVWELPEGWETARIGECVIDVSSGFACAKKHAVAEGLPHLRPFNVGMDGKLDLSDTIHIPEDFKAGVERYYLEAGDVLFNNTNSVELVGKSAIVHKPLRCAFSNHITRLRVDRDRLLPEWLVLSLRQLWADGFFAARCRKRIGQAGFNTGMLAEVEIPLPALDEQRRIVEYLDGVQAQVAELKRLQAESAAELERLSGAVLARAFRGEL
jgi:type I restriction enzyme S subunit